MLTSHTHSNLNEQFPHNDSEALQFNAMKINTKNNKLQPKKLKVRTCLAIFFFTYFFVVMSRIFSDNSERFRIAKRGTNMQHYAERTKIHTYARRHRPHTSKLKWRIWSVSRCQKSILIPLFFVVPNFTFLITFETIYSTKSVCINRNKIFLKISCIKCHSFMCCQFKCHMLHLLN